MYSTIYKYRNRKHKVISFSENEVAEFPVHRVCPTCRTTEKPLTLVTLACHSWDVGLYVVECKVCKVVYFQNPPTEKSLLEHYNSHWRADSVKKPVDELSTAQVVRSKIVKLLEDLDFHDKEARILDVGCGLGGMMAGLKERGFGNCFGIEPSRNLSRSASLRFPGKVFSGSYEDYPQCEKFDVIYTNHVFEHLYRPESVIKWMRSRLSEEGFIIICVPDNQVETVMNQTLFLPHLHSFSPKSLFVLASGVDLKVRYWIGSPRNDEICAVIYPEECKLVSDGHTEKFLSLEQVGSRSYGTQKERFDRLWVGASQKQKATQVRHRSRRQLVNWPTDNWRITNPKQRWIGFTSLPRYLHVVFWFLWLKYRLSLSHKIVGRGDRLLYAILSRLYSSEIIDTNYCVIEQSNQAESTRVGGRFNKIILATK